ncbi:MAG TPA: ATP-grasp domain-containing protein [Fimbriimonadaceae bacterium]|nr:ATP-grasp domain-containing protein [Fimbriimonadaceae bacterium]
MLADIGFLGGGQLARMSIQAAQKMGLTCLSLDPGKETPASLVARSRVGSLGDAEAVAAILKDCRHCALENDFIPATSLRDACKLAGIDEGRLSPSLGCLATIQDKLEQRRALAGAGVPTPHAVALEGDAAVAVREIGFPMVIKARFGGYDGKGTRIAQSREELDGFRELWGSGGWLAETYVPFRRELAVMVARSAHQTLELETVETQQRDYICDVTYPARLWDPSVDTKGVPVAAVEAVNGFGLFGVELFELETGAVLVNEMAPRPHNTGHYSLNWGDLSQFEIHVRLVCGLPLPKPSDGRLKGLPVYMANLMGIENAGDHRRGIERALEIEPSARFHWYGKVESRPGRKMGHVNLVVRHEEPPHAMLPHLNRVRDAFYEGWAQD